jgi:hypothetical protein
MMMVMMMKHFLIKISNYDKGTYINSIEYYKNILQV